MRWLDPDGSPLPIEQVFAEHLHAVRLRAGVASRNAHYRTRHDETPVMTVRDHAGTRQMEGVEGRICDPSSWRLS